MSQWFGIHGDVKDVIDSWLLNIENSSIWQVFSHPIVELLPSGLFITDFQVVFLYVVIFMSLFLIIFHIVIVTTYM